MKWDVGVILTFIKMMTRDSIRCSCDVGSLILRAAYVHESYFRNKI